MICHREYAKQTEKSNETALVLKTNIELLILMPNCCLMLMLKLQMKPSQS